MNVVIGSGPAGVAAASALVDLGESVTMLDAGGTLEPSAVEAAARLARRGRETWTNDDRALIQGPLRLNSEGAPLKLAFGSDYVYRDVQAYQPVDARGVEAYRGFATGGLSALWGAAVLAFNAGDLDRWPLGVADLEDGYRRALALTGLAGEDDALAARYPLYVAPGSRLPLSAQAGAVLDTMSRNGDALARAGIRFGRARLAVSSSGRDDGCRQCGMCLYGCPWGLIYHARTTVDALLHHASRFRYVPGVVVRRLIERTDRVTIETEPRGFRGAASADTFEASRVYLAAGTVGSTAILLASLPHIESVTLRQSEHLLMPMALRRSVGHVAAERLHTLSQLFLEFGALRGATRPVHLQVYTYNDFYERMARARLGGLYPLVAPLATRLIDRLVLLKGYLHSDDSRTIEARLDATRFPTVVMTATPRADVMAIARGVVRMLRRHGRQFGLVPVPLAWRLGLPGSSVHLGGSFPMTARPEGAASDSLGRPSGLRRVHVVDASVFPTLPAAPPTLTVMANAIRIVRTSTGCGEVGA